MNENLEIVLFSQVPFLSFNCCVCTHWVLIAGQKCFKLYTSVCMNVCTNEIVCFYAPKPSKRLLIFSICVCVCVLMKINRHLAKATAANWSVCIICGTQNDTTKNMTMRDGKSERFGTEQSNNTKQKNWLCTKYFMYGKRASIACSNFLLRSAY